MVFNFLTDLQSRYNDIIKSGVVDKVLADGAAKANAIANKKIRKVYKKVGFAI